MPPSAFTALAPTTQIQVMSVIFDVMQEIERNKKIISEKDYFVEQISPLVSISKLELLDVFDWVFPPEWVTIFFSFFL